MLTTANIQKPQLCEARKYDSTSHLPPYSILETESDFEIALNLFGASKTMLYVFVSQDRKRLHVMGKKALNDNVAQFLWIFNLPPNVNPDEITVDSKSDVYMIFLPKQALVPPMSLAYRTKKQILKTA